MVLNLDSLTVVAGGLDHPEAVTVGPDGLLYAGSESGDIYRIPADGGSAEVIANVGGFVLGLCCDGASNLYVCDWGGRRIARVDRDGSVDTYCDSANGRPLTCPNYCLFDADGRLWLSDSGSEEPTPTGRVVRVSAGGGDAEVLDIRPLRFSNGLALGQDGRLFIVESLPDPGIAIYADGMLQDYARLPGTVPDGVALTQDGVLYVSCFQPNRIVRIAAEDQTIDVVLEDWTGLHLLTPTNVSFYGADLDRLAIASLGGWDIKSVVTSDRGQPLFYP
jgi:gluconolactonase